MLTIVNKKNGGHVISRSEKRVKHIVLVYNTPENLRVAGQIGPKLIVLFI
jgi:hypothetical protein